LKTLTIAPFWDGTPMALPTQAACPAVGKLQAGVKGGLEAVAKRCERETWVTRRVRSEVRSE
jgi:hypothetical protein